MKEPDEYNEINPKKEKLKGEEEVHEKQLIKFIKIYLIKY